ncbi:GNAT family N-acetyltransferase [Brevibacillus humidisoli]|uniref:GNAT family N-acetyltransferase n=1 Tax=Brevibacillus humidisoli TaxID=2895522 RepID=UPI001E53A961|nr:GNAT family N-acetyltransferase [Brevibacillus humidisoli]UFJ41493.1 GNAT family N-acetyltransferase [Brevibacillus humidisoli]
MGDVRPLGEEDLERFVTITAQAYPGLRAFSGEARKRVSDRYQQIYHEHDHAVLYGYYQRDELLGGMILYDFTMNVLSVDMLAGGVGSVAVDLLHKKEKVAKELLSFFVRHYRQRGAAMTLLYPFRPDFYKQMGFGYGTRINQYKCKPAALPRKAVKQHLAYLSQEDMPDVLDCYHRYSRSRHGMIRRTAFDLMPYFRQPENVLVGYRRKGVIRGYLIGQFQKRYDDHLLPNDLVVKELIYETPEALLELCTFLHTQADQVNRIVINTQDDSFHHLLQDPRNDREHIIPSVFHESSVSGVGLMYRVVDAARFYSILDAHDFGGQTCKLKLTLRDSFLPENEGSIILHVNDGRVTLVTEGEHDLEVRMDVSDFSPLVMGVVRFKQLYHYGLAELSDPRQLDVVDRFFRTEEKPVCMTSF